MCSFWVDKCNLWASLSGWGTFPCRPCWYEVFIGETIKFNLGLIPLKDFVAEVWSLVSVPFGISEVGRFVVLAHKCFFSWHLHCAAPIFFKYLLIVRLEAATLSFCTEACIFSWNCFWSFCSLAIVAEMSAFLTVVPLHISTFKYLDAFYSLFLIFKFSYFFS